MDYADKLEALAAYLRAHPKVAECLGDYDRPSIHVYVEEPEAFSAVCRDMGGFKKSAHSGTVTAIHRDAVSADSWEANFTVAVNLSGACEAKETGEIKTRPVFIPEGAYMANGAWVVDEAVKEYHCPESFLNL